MEVLLLGIYSVFVWLIFFKFKWLPWNIVSQVIVVTIPIIALTVLILFLNIYAPSSHDVRTINYVVQVVPRVTGRVIEVPVEPNRPVKKGDVLFRVDPVPFELEVAAARSNITALKAKLLTAGANERGIGEQLKSATGKKAALQARLDLANKRLAQFTELARAGAGSRFDREQAQTEVDDLTKQMAAADAAEAEAMAKFTAKTPEGVQDEVAKVRAEIAQAESQLGDAEWKLRETTVFAPANGTIVNLQLRVGSTASQFAGLPVMSFVEDEQWIIATFAQNEVRDVEPGNEAEIAVRTHPGRVIKCKVDSVIWATAQGQLPMGGSLPGGASTYGIPEGRLAVRLELDGKDKGLFLAAGARGQAAIYTEHGKMIHILRKVIIRVGSKLDWLILKLH
jgi:multidrug resistance efflux pump